ncbi:YitT family protein [Neolewinella litorea]|uniref:YitT family protein n=1 Tax=Neolewinella litorea TaxID=2562452 RepID=A0A4S4NTB3_9BACT|nr:YitT family protein [Neolewinella litorea]THH41698.1 YitT family protein [Neolewinella litorea]
MTLLARLRIVDISLIVLGVFLAAFGLEGFLLPNQFIDGGVTGICLLVSQVTGLPLALLLIVINLPFLYLAGQVIGRKFAIKTAMAIFLLALVVYFVHFPQLTNDTLLVSVFGGFFLGTGIGLSMRGGSVLDGTEVLAIYLSRRIGAKVSDWVILINVIIFLTAAMLLSVEQALYSVLTYFVASKALDFIIDGVEEYTGIFIISPLNDEIRTALISQVGCGVTQLRGQGGFGLPDDAPDRQILYVVVTRLEIYRLLKVVRGIDEHAFITMNSINDVHGGMVKRRKI